MSVGKDYTAEVAQTVEPLHYTQNEWYLPQHPFRLLNCGPSGSGKSNLLLGLLFGMERNGRWTPPVNYHKVYYYCQDTNEDKFEFIRNKFSQIDRKRKRKNKQSKPIMEYSSNPDDVIDWKSLDKSLMNLIIFDDMITESNKAHKRVSDLFILGRKQNASVIYLTQALTPVPRIIRLNSTCLILFEPELSNEVPIYLTYYAGPIGRKALGELLSTAFDKPFGFVFIDHNKRLPVHMRYRLGFDNINKALTRSKMV